MLRITRHPVFTETGNRKQKQKYSGNKISILYQSHWLCNSGFSLSRGWQFGRYFIFSCVSSSCQTSGNNRHFFHFWQVFLTKSILFSRYGTICPWLKNSGMKFFRCLRPPWLHSIRWSKMIFNTNSPSASWELMSQKKAGNIKMKLISKNPVPCIL